MSTQLQLFGLHIPITFENELEKFANSRATYVMYSDAAKNLSDAAIKQMGSYMVGPMAVGPVEPSNTNFFNYNESLPNVLNYENSNFSLFSNIVLEYIPQEPVHVKEGEKKYVVGGDLRVAVIPSICVLIEGGRVAGWSESLKKDLQDYFRSDSRFRGKPFDSSVAALLPSELFGSDSDINGVTGVFFDKALGTETVTTVTSIAKGASISGISGSGWLYLSSRDYNLRKALINLGSNNTYYIEIKDGGGEAEYSSVGGSDKREDNSSITFKSIIKIEGKASPNASVVVTFDNGETAHAFADNQGNWRVPTPRIYQQEGTLDNVKVKEIIREGAVVSSSFNQKSNPVNRLSNGLPVLAPYRNSPRIGANSYRYKGDALEGFANLRQSGVRFLGTPGAKVELATPMPDFARFGILSFSLRPEQIEKRYFISYPGAVIRSTGFILLFKSEPHVEGPVFLKDRQYTLVKEDFIFVAEVRLGLDRPNRNNIFITSSWRRNFGEPRSLRLYTKWLRSWEPSRIKLKTSFKVGTTKSLRSLMFRTSWLTDRASRRRLRLYTRFRSWLPEKEVGRAFYIFRYTSKGFYVKNLTLQTSYISEHPKRMNLTFRAPFQVHPVEPVKIVPFYVRKEVDGEPIEHMISYAVYGVDSEVQNYILENSLNFYFSNPTSFEIIRFDYNGLPYVGVNVSSIDSPSLKATGNDVPDTYSLIGNYTIKGINTINSFSLDVVGKDRQLNEARSYWMPEDIKEWDKADLSPVLNKPGLFYYKLTKDFKDNHHEDVVELDLIILNEKECCFTRKTSGSRCSPY